MEASLCTLLLLENIKYILFFPVLPRVVEHSVMNSLFSPQPAPALHAQTWQLEYLAIINTDVIEQAEFRELYTFNWSAVP